MRTQRSIPPAGRTIFVGVNDCTIRETEPSVTVAGVVKFAPSIVSV
jgi:hypothetical protein